MPVFFHNPNRDDLVFQTTKKVNFTSFKLQQICLCLKFYSQKFNLPNFSAIQLGIPKNILVVKIKNNPKLDYFLPPISKEFIHHLQISSKPSFLDKLIKEDEYQFFINSELKNNFKIFINPSIQEFIGHSVLNEETNFNIFGVKAQVERNNEIKVAYLNENLEKKEEILKDKIAFCFQQARDFCEEKNILSFSRNKFKLFQNIESIPSEFEKFFATLNEVKNEARTYTEDAEIKEIIDREMYADILDEEFKDEYNKLLLSLNNK
jgi:peptide deformylase